MRPKECSKDSTKNRGTPVRDAKFSQFATKYGSQQGPYSVWELSNYFIGWIKIKMYVYA